MKFPENLVVLDCPEMAQAFGAEWDSISAMADTTTTHELLVSTFATADALAKLLIEKGLITQAEFMAS